MGFLQPTTKTSVSEGQTDEFAVTASEFDKVIPKVWGNQRLSGNIIWANEIREEKVTDVQTTGGKGGSPKQETTTTTFLYYVNLAVAFAEGPALNSNSFIKFFGDGKTIYDATQSQEIIETDLNAPDAGDTFNGSSFVENTEVVVGSEPVQMEGLVFRFYTGDETQLPDPLIEADIGVGSTPAYRGLCYVVLEDFPLADFGNRIPSFTAQIVYDGQASDVDAVTFDQVIGYASQNIRVICFDDTQVYIGMGDFNNQRLNTLSINNTAQTPLFQENFSGAGIQRNFGMKAVLGNGNLVGTYAQGNSASPGFRQVEYTQTLQEVTQIFTPFGQSPRGAAAYPGLPDLALFCDQTDQTGSTTVRISVYDSGANTNVMNNLTTVPLSTALGAVPGQTGQCWAITRPNDRSQIDFRRVVGQSLSTVYTVLPSDIVPGGVQFTGFIYSPYDPVLNLFFVTSGIDGVAYSFAYRPDVGVIWTRQIESSAIPNNADHSDFATLNGGFVLYNRDRVFTLQNLATGEIDDVFDGVTQQVFEDTSINPAGGGGCVAWHEPSGTFWGESSGAFQGAYKGTLVISNDASVNPRVILTEISSRVGLNQDDIDVENVPAVVEGLQSFIIDDDRASAKEAMQPLLDLIQVQAFESDFKLKFQKLGVNTSVVSISQDQFIETEDNDGESYTRPRIKARDLPKRFEVSYLDAATDYQDAVQRDERSDAVTTSQKVGSLDYPGALSSDYARQAAQILLYTPWAERDRVKTRLPWRYIYLDPSDIIVFNFDEGDSLQGRVITSDIGVSLQIDIEAIVEVEGQYVSSIQGNSGDGLVQPLPPFTGNSEVVQLDIPLLRDVDDQNGTASITYWGGNGEPVWNGVQLYLIEGTQTTSTLGKTTNEMPFGVITVPPPDITNFTRFANDESLTIEVVRNPEFFASVTEADIIAGNNVIIVLKPSGEAEIMQYEIATVDPGNPNLITLSKLLRGRRGTEVFGTGFSVGDIVIYATTNTLSQYSRAISTLNSTSDYKGVTLGQLFENALTFQFTDSGRDLKPYAPTQIEATSDGASGFNIDWVRRTRLGGENDLVTNQEVPLGETTEAYEVEILDSPGGTVLRTFTGLTTPTVNYTNADIITDFGSVPSSLNVVVYQISSVIGRGFPGIATLDVSNL